MDAAPPELAPGHPAIHLAPPTGWMNDPNGLVFVDGTWHACYQHFPHDDLWGPMHWRHAVSHDLTTWTDHGIALYPDELGNIFSGSAVIADASTPFPQGSIVAVFTHADHCGQRQSLAWSEDDGATWTKYAGNPVLESDQPDFRDPKVVRVSEGGTEHWAMAIAAGDHVAFYASTDLVSWSWTGRYDHGIGASHGTVARGVWECPDLIAFDAPDGGTRWLLTFSVMDGGEHGNGATFGVIGSFRDGTFAGDAQPQMLDHGPDCYAMQSFSGRDDAVAMAWMSSWKYARSTPSAGRRGMLTVPRRLELAELDGDLVVLQRPAVDLPTAPVGDRRWVSRPGHAVVAVLDDGTSLSVQGPSGIAAELRVTDGTVILHRHTPGSDDLSLSHRAPLHGPGPHQVVIDHGSIEFFSADGRTVLTALVFPGHEWTVEVSPGAELRIVGDTPPAAS